MIINKDIEEFNTLIKDFVNQYKVKQDPIEVSFKDIVRDFKSNERFTHQIHSYPAKLLVHIPYFFLNNTHFSNEGDIVLDPFNGSGTVCLESILANRIFYGADANPLANLISKVKISNLDASKLENTLKKIVNKSEKRLEYTTPQVRNLNFWFPKDSIIPLSNLYSTIVELKNNDIRDFFLVSFSNMVKKVSYCDTRISVPVKLNPDRYSDADVRQKIHNKINAIENTIIYEKFSSICVENIRRTSELNKTIFNKNNFRYLSSDARHLKMSKNEILPNNSVKLIITSPPYAGAQKYIRASSLNLGWTSLASLQELNILERNNIGREVFSKFEIDVKETGIKEADAVIAQIKNNNTERAFIAFKYIQEMKAAIDEIYRVLQPDGHLILIIGNNKITGIEFNTQEYLTSYASSIGMLVEFKLIDDIKSYGLMTKRNKTADIISREYVLVLKK